MRLVVILAASFATAFVVLYLVMSFVPGARAMVENRFIFFPDRQLLETPDDWGLSFEEVQFEASDGVKLHGWFVPGEGDVTWIWFHGNGGNISHRLEHLTLLHSRLDVNIFLFDYRGYGRSEGRASERGTYRDAIGALDYVLSRQDVDPQRIVYSGHSLGAAVAVWLATQHRPFGLVLESPFTSIKDMAKISYPFLPLHLLVRGKYDSLSKIAKVSCPLLFLHGEKDEMVPISQGKKLYEAALEPKSFYVVEGAGHNDTYLVDQEPYFRALADFITSLGGQQN